MNKQDGLKQKYTVEKANGKAVGKCIVLEFSKEENHAAIQKWAESMLARGYAAVYVDTMHELQNHIAQKP
jgi:hypothetical protein